MSPLKGVRKSRNAPPPGIRLGRHVVPPGVAVAGLMALLYAWVLVSGAYEGADFLAQLILFALFAAILVLLGMARRLYSPLATTFLLLAVPPFTWAVVGYLGRDKYFGIVGLLLGVLLAGALLYRQKGRLSDAFVQAGDLRDGLRIGLAALVAMAVLAAAVAAIYYGAGGRPMSLVLPVAGALFVFSAGCGLGEEFLFRGLLLSRLLPVTGTVAALAYQAIAFAAYASAFLYLLTADPLYAALVFVVAGLAGTALGWVTLQSKSLLAAVLAHAGLYLVLLLPVFAPYIA